MAGPGRPDEDFGERQRIGREFVIELAFNQLDGGVVMGVGSVENGDEHAGVEHDHGGHSERSSSR